MGGVIRTNIGAAGHLPRLEGESPDIAPATPIAVVGLWVMALRARFNYNPSEPLPWVWSPDYTPETTEDGNPLPDGEPRKIVIESAFNTEKSVRNYRPAIYVNRGEVTPTRSVIDNRVGVHIPSALQAFFCQASLPISFECESENAVESELIADTAWFHVLACRDLFRKTFGLHEIVEPTLGQTRPLDEDKEVWRTQVTFNTVFDLRWSTRPIAPLVRDIVAHIETDAEGDATLLYHKIALRDSEG